MKSKLRHPACRTRRPSAWVRLILILLLAILLTAGCANVTPRTDMCAPWSPIYVSADDVLTDGTARQINAHDETGARLCGWKPTHHGANNSQNK